MEPTTVEHILEETHRRLAALGRSDPFELDVCVERDAVVVAGEVEDAFTKSLVEAIARELGGGRALVSRLGVRVDIGAEAAAKDTEFGDAGAARNAVGTIPRPA
jgi:hypothetical protein